MATLTGDAFNNHIAGTVDADLIDGGGGRDTLLGGGGDDSVIGGDGADSLDGGTGNDTFLIATEPFGVADVIRGGTGNDLVRFAAGTEIRNLTVNAAASVETLDMTEALRGTGVADRIDISGIKGFVAAQAIHLYGYDDWLNGSIVGETVDGGTGDDTLTGNGGDDFLAAGTGADSLSGGAGNDTFFFVTDEFSAADTIRGGAGSDQVGLAAGAVISKLTLDVAAGVETLDMTNALTGTAYADRIDLRGVKTFIAAKAIALSAGDDFFAGSSLGETVDGSIGADTLLGNGGDDHLIGGNASDRLEGGAGNDTFLITTDTSSGADTIRGGAGSDVVASAAGAGIANLTLNAAASVETIDMTNALAGTNFVDRIDIGGVRAFVAAQAIALYARDDRFNGSGLGETVDGGGDADTLLGNAGDDSLIGGSGIDSLVGGAGNDSFLIAAERSEAPDLIRGGAGDDMAVLAVDLEIMNLRLDVAASVETLDMTNTLGGTPYADRIDISGIETIVAAKTIALDVGDDWFKGSALGDTVDGHNGADTLLGNGGNDSLIGRSGADSLDGGLGNDTFLIVTDLYSGADTIRGGAGIDTALLDWNLSIANLTLDAAASVETLDMTVGLRGSPFADRIDISGVRTFIAAKSITLGGGDDLFAGSTLAETVDGGSDADTLQGGGGNDVLYGRTGTDELAGGAGADLFVFTRDDSPAATPDRILDFAHLVDRIDLSAIDASTTAPGDQAFSFGSGGFTGVAGQLRFDAATHLLAGDTNGDGAADFAIVLENVTTLDASDFVL